MWSIRPRRFSLLWLAVLGLLLAGPGVGAACAQGCGGWRADERPCAPSWLPAPLTWLVPQQVGGADFRPACRAHDNCYGTAVWSRRSCDLAFRDHLLAACDRSRYPLACRAAAQSMFLLTRGFGQSSYGVRY